MNDRAELEPWSSNFWDFFSLSNILPYAVTMQEFNKHTLLLQNHRTGQPLWTLDREGLVGKVRIEVDGWE
jgi:hypothetical protein